jgi:hypothetical protein
MARLASDFIDSLYFVLKAPNFVLLVAVMVMVGIAFDSTQSVFLYYTNRLHFISVERNLLAIYLLQAGYWYGLVIWEASLGFLAV